MSHTSWLEPILPETFWDKDMMKSWVLFKVKVSPSVMAPDKKEVKGLFHLNIPRTELEVETHRTNSQMETSFILKAKKTEVESKVLKVCFSRHGVVFKFSIDVLLTICRLFFQTFADLVYVSKYEVGESGERTLMRNLNLTVPRHSVAVDSSAMMLGETTKCKIVFTFSKMIPKAESDWFHVT